MTDPFASYARTTGGPAIQHVTLIADAEVDLDPRPQAIYCHAAGTITLRDEAGTDLPYTMEDGYVLPMRAVRVTAISGGTFYGLL
ncbi:MAG: hypothetical protein AAF968_22355 [Pseudomonadota bacterium]